MYVQTVLSFCVIRIFKVDEIDDRRALLTLCFLACSVTQLIFKGLQFSSLLGKHMFSRLFQI